MAGQTRHRAVTGRVSVARLVVHSTRGRPAARHRDFIDIAGGDHSDARWSSARASRVCELWFAAELCHRTRISGLTADHEGRPVSRRGEDLWTEATRRPVVAKWESFGGGHGSGAEAEAVEGCGTVFGGDPMSLDADVRISCVRAGALMASSTKADLGAKRSDTARSVPRRRDRGVVGRARRDVDGGHRLERQSCRRSRRTLDEVVKTHRSCADALLMREPVSADSGLRRRRRTARWAAAAALSMRTFSPRLRGEAPAAADDATVNIMPNATPAVPSSRRSVRPYGRDQDTKQARRDATTAAPPGRSAMSDWCVVGYLRAAGWSGPRNTGPAT